MAGRSAEDPRREPSVTGDPTRCGCAGKTPLERVVRPARAAMAASLAGSGVDLGADADAAAFPATEGIERETRRTAIDPGSAAVPHEAPESDDGGDDATWALTATFADRSLARDSATFAAGVGDALGDLARGGAGPVRVGKGHAVQVPGAGGATQWTELLRPVGPRRPGYRVGNVDVVHAFPGLDPPTQARVATVHALNDCHAAGASRERAVRPVVVAPGGTALASGTVREWYLADAPGDVTVLPATVLDRGDGWLFGATATATTDREVPLAGVDAGDRLVRPGDAVVLHRAVGGMATLATTAASDADPGEAVDQATAALTRDHREVADAIAAFRPPAGETVDPSRHVLATTDVSGPGIRGVGRRIARADDRLGLRIERLPVLDPAVDAAADRWLLPDATVETNGPVAVVARPPVAARVTETLAAIPGADPVRIGRVATTGDGALEAASGVALDRYVETADPGGDRA